MSVDMKGRSETQRDAILLPAGAKRIAAAAHPHEWSQLMNIALRLKAD
jgi:hypothetical protein